MDKAKAILDSIRAEEGRLRAKGVSRLYLYGSFARGDARQESDVDLFLDPARGDFSLLDLIELEQLLSDCLHLDVDLATRDCLHRALRPQIEAEARLVF